jgi:anaerobic magnesium-protoporphyrin IX monomethyl ester cyclase
MKVLLAIPPIMDYSNSRSWGELVPIAQDSFRECHPDGVYMLASILRQSGHEVVVADLIALGSDKIDLYERDIENCSLIGISVNSLSWPTAYSVIRQIRRMGNGVPIVLGGIHATMFDCCLLRQFRVQYVAGFPQKCESRERGAECQLQHPRVPGTSFFTPSGP